MSLKAGKLFLKAGNAWKKKCICQLSIIPIQTLLRKYLEEERAQEEELKIVLLAPKVKDHW